MFWNLVLHQSSSESREVRIQLFSISGQTLGFLFENWTKKKVHKLHIPKQKVRAHKS
jgi:hypothetical protein